jgi:hypothetical protein
MSTIPDPNAPLTPEEAVQVLQAMRTRVPDFSLLTLNDSQTLSRAAAVDTHFVHEAINAIAASPNLRDALGRNAEELRQSLELTDRWSQVVVELDKLRVGVLGSMKVRRHRIGATALQVYQMSRQLARYRENATLLPHIDAMRRTARFPKRSAPPALTPSVTPPEPVPVPPAPEAT